jgi:hypothetical protein
MLALIYVALENFDFFEFRLIKRPTAKEGLIRMATTGNSGRDTPVAQFGSAGHVSERVWVQIPCKP